MPSWSDRAAALPFLVLGASAIGLLHEYTYYNEFGISYLSFADPSDLFFSWMSNWRLVEVITFPASIGILWLIVNEETGTPSGNERAAAAFFSALLAFGAWTVYFWLRREYGGENGSRQVLVAVAGVLIAVVSNLLWDFFLREKLSGCAPTRYVGYFVLLFSLVGFVGDAGGSAEEQLCESESRGGSHWAVSIRHGDVAPTCGLTLLGSAGDHHFFWLPGYAADRDPGDERAYDSEVNDHGACDDDDALAARVALAASGALGRAVIISSSDISLVQRVFPKGDGRAESDCERFEHRRSGHKSQFSVMPPQGNSASREETGSAARTAQQSPRASSIMRVNADRLNFRLSPEVDAGNIVGKLSDACQVRILGQEGAWKRVELANCPQTGWVSAAYLAPSRQKNKISPEGKTFRGSAGPESGTLEQKANAAGVKSR